MGSLQLRAVNTAELASDPATATATTLSVGQPQVPLVLVVRVTQTLAEIEWKTGI